MAAPLDLRLLRTLVEVQRAGSITAAAAVLGLSQPAVSGQIQSLERQLGRALFRREPRGVVATPLAEMLALEAAPHVDALQQIVSTGSGERSSLEGLTVSLGGPAELLTALVVPALAPLVARGLRFRVSLGLPDPLLAEISTGTLDLVVSTVRPRRGSHHAVPLCDEELVLVGAAGAADLLASASTDPARWRAALDEQPLVAYAESLPLIRRYWSLALGGQPTRRPALVVADLRGVLTAVVAGIGISVLPRYLCQPALDDATLHALASPEVPPINTIHLVVAPGRRTERHVAAVAELLLAAGRRW